MGKVKRIYVEKKTEYAVAAEQLKEELESYLNINKLEKVRIFARYDIENLSEDVFEQAVRIVFSEPPVDILYREEFPHNESDHIFSVEYLPGQYDQRADSAEQCVKLLNEEEEPVIRTAVTYVLEGDLTEQQFNAVREYCINPVDSRESGLKKPETLITVYDEPGDVEILQGFAGLDRSGLESLYNCLGLAMTINDFLHIHKYFSEEEKRDPSITEIRVLDTYWSDHCRHTTFQTELVDIGFGEGYYAERMKETFEKYKEDRRNIFGDRKDKYICLMDLALMAMRKLKKEGKLDDQEESEEINACSIVIPVEIDGETQEWLLNFKNETHNHPTEIEPFGGAATCLGGAIRDPLSGRTYVYQAMRVTGAADPTVPVEETMAGKLPQKKIVREAAHGYSSYGNQIGLATGMVKEIYHPGYVAKRMEIGAVLGAAPRANVIRETPDPGDIIILLGGRTGRDGCGGATGSSKVHTEESIESSGAEVQKGNAPTERKIQRLFRRPEVSSLIKKCNDFGAGGVSVAIGELADGLRINLDKVPKKYAGLDGTELAISESQERMAVVVAPSDTDRFLAFAAEENLEATVVAEVTEDPRLVLTWRGKDVVNVSRAFLDTNGARQEAQVSVRIPDKAENYFTASEIGDFEQKYYNNLKDLNVCSQKGLVERFDSSIGSGTVLMPYGGKHQMTEIQAMVAKIPVLKGNCDTVSIMSYGFDPYLSKWSPYHGAVYAVMESVSKVVAAGGDYEKIRFTFQEYFGKTSKDASSWSEPFSALLGAYDAQLGLGLPSIGGKDSMSGTFNEISVPPTLVSFAVDVAKSGEIISPEFKRAGNKLVQFKLARDEFDLPDYEQAKKIYTQVHSLILNKVIVSAYSVDAYGISAAASKMAFGNLLGVRFADDVTEEELFYKELGSIIAEVDQDRVEELKEYGSCRIIGELISARMIASRNKQIDLEEAVVVWQHPLEKVFPTRASVISSPVNTSLYTSPNVYTCRNKVARPKVFIPVFPGTNCEFDSARAFEKAGADVDIKVFRNLNASDIRDSVQEFKKSIDQAQIIMFPGGFSGGDEPDGSAKFFATAFRNSSIKDAVNDLLKERDGLILGICNGFQALIKLGLVPHGEITGQEEESPTLTFNTINRHVSKMVYTKVVSDKSPWLAAAGLNETYVNPASHGEGRFVASTEWLQKLFAAGQVATQYTDLLGKPSTDEEWDVNGSFMAVEGITSPDGRCFGKMLHVERCGNDIAKNIYGNQDLKIFESGVKYFK
ncbi:phosphoribosylformylglycinamidine synthase [Parasporobacterium paucivorans]|uniref:Phosphoribosylformylglycinamidine synthase n=1 Tax=Parasporobacterium paucivorans DSM 15970 TaxID=1122934 RepID=A0A1M6FKG0_9FIRM|nr:phosphoribosylformylglycinamidine synthase [Parasporobacterium paucivorans]SHI98153.1 phosphoribosylformylglycinamidine synthase [Parasporobacterium paucivorans DSM 15970]